MAIMVQVLGTTATDFNFNTTQFQGVRSIWAGLTGAQPSWVSVEASDVPAAARRRLLATDPVLLRSAMPVSDLNTASQSVQDAYASGSLAAQFAALGLTLVNGTLQIIHSDSSSSSTNVAAIVGGSVGGAVGLVLLAGLGYVVYSRRKARAQAGGKDARFEARNPVFEAEDVEAKVGTPSSAGGLSVGPYGAAEAAAKGGSWANPAFGGAEAADAGNPLFAEGADSPSVAAEAARQPREFSNAAFDGLDTPKGEASPANPLYDTQGSQLSGPDREERTYAPAADAPDSEAPAAYANPAFAEQAGPSGRAAAPVAEDTNPLYDSDADSQLSGPGDEARYAHVTSHPIDASSPTKRGNPLAADGANPLFGSEVRLVIGCG